MEYWDYYHATFCWNDGHELVRPSLDLTRRRFSEIGLSETESQAFVDSGFVMLSDNIVIDRFHGGAPSVR